MLFGTHDACNGWQQSTVAVAHGLLVLQLLTAAAQLPLRAEMLPQPK